MNRLLKVGGGCDKMLQHIWQCQLHDEIQSVHGFGG